MASVANTFLPTIWAQESLMVLRDNLVMAGLVHRDYEAALATAGQSVRTRLPSKLTAHTWTGQTGTNADATAAETKRVDLLTAGNVTITLDEIAYTSYLIQDHEAAMSIKNLVNEYIVPAIDPLSQRLDDSIMTEFTSSASTDVFSLPVDVIADGTVGLGAAMDAGDIIEADLQLNVDQAPRAPRYLVLSPQHNADLLGNALFQQANTAGTTEALRNANLGRAFGFTVYMSQNVPDAVDTDTTSQSIAFHPNALALVTRDLDIDTPNQNGARAGRAAIDGISIRVVSQYHSLMNGLGVVSEILFGTKLLDNRLAKIINP
jgi:coat protein Gp5